MPYVSDKQRRWAHTDSAKKSGFPTAKWDAETYGKKVARKKKKGRKR